jgi:hypothetical protein
MPSSALPRSHPGTKDRAANVVIRNAESFGEYLKQV